MPTSTRAPDEGIRAARIRPAATEDARAFFGFSLPWPWFGLAAEVNGTVVGLGGIAWREDGAFVFLNCPRKFMPSPLMAHRLALRVLASARAAGEDAIYVVPTPGVATAKKWLTALGFRFERDGPEGEVWKCRA